MDFLRLVFLREDTVRASSFELVAFTNSDAAALKESIDIAITDVILNHILM